MDFLKTLLKSKTAPKNALRFIAQSMGNHAYTVADGLSKHTGFAAELLGGKDGYGELAKITAKPTGRHETNTLAVILAGFEKSLTRQSWRNPSGTAKHYLTQLTTWGYTLSDVETIITDHSTDPSPAQEPGETFAQVQADEEELTAEEADYADES